MNLRDIHTSFICLFRLHALGVSDGLSLIALERIESTDRRYSLLCMMDDRECAISIILEFLYGNAASESTTQFACMIEEIRLSLEVHHTTVVSKGTRFLQWHDFSLVFPRSERFLAHRVSDMLRHTTCRIEHIIVFASLHKPRTLGIIIFIFHGRVTILHIRSTKAIHGHVDSAHLSLVINGFLRVHSVLQANHVVIQLGIIEMRIAPIEICLPIIIYPDRRIDVIPLTIIKERFAECILERTCRRIAHGNTDGDTTTQLGVGADIPVIFAISLDGLCRPGTVIRPGEGREVERRAMVGPVHHIFGRIDTPFVHPEEISPILIVSGIDIEGIPIHHRCRVGRQLGLYDRILRIHCCAQVHTQCRSNQKLIVHCLSKIISFYF